MAPARKMRPGFRPPTHGPRPAAEVLVSPREQLERDGTTDPGMEKAVRRLKGHFLVTWIVFPTDLEPETCDQHIRDGGIRMSCGCAGHKTIAEALDCKREWVYSVPGREVRGYVTSFVPGAPTFIRSMPNSWTLDREPLDEEGAGVEVAHG